jgi:PAS domain S-box-containing protein
MSSIVRQKRRERPKSAALTNTEHIHHTFTENENRFQQMADHAPVMIWISGIDKMCTWFNKPWLQFTGRTMEEELGNGWVTGIHPEDLQQCLKTYVANFDRREAFAMEYRMRRFDGEWRWILDNGVPLSEMDSFKGYIGSCIDVTDRKQAERELIKYREDLRTMASELMLAQERERRRLAQDLHDGLGQALFRARLQLDRLSSKEPDVKKVTAILEEMGQMISTMTFALSPVILHNLGLRHAIKSLASDMNKQFGLSVEIEDDGRDIPIEEHIGLVLFRSVRELLINVAKHAGTKKATLSMNRIQRTLQITIQDRGRGFNLADQSTHVDSGHFGLFSIRERLAYHDGKFTIRSKPSAGTTVTLSVPLSIEVLQSRARSALP